MAHILRAWLAFASLGAGILHLALVLGSPPPLAVGLIVLGIAECAWTVTTLSQGRFVMVRTARSVATAPILTWAAVLLLAGVIDAPAVVSSSSFVPLAVATLLDLVIAVGLTFALRSAERMPASAEPGAWRYLGGLSAGALAVAMVVTPAMSLTQAGLNSPHAPHAPATGVGAEVDGATIDLPAHSGH